MNGGDDAENGCCKVSEFEYTCPGACVDPPVVDPVVPSEPESETESEPEEPVSPPTDDGWLDLLHQFFHDYLWAQLSIDVDARMNQERGYVGYPEDNPNPTDIAIQVYEGNIHAPGAFKARL